MNGFTLYAQWLDAFREAEGLPRAEIGLRAQAWSAKSTSDKAAWVALAAQIAACREEPK